MKKTLIGIIMLIMVSSLLISCVENIPKNDTPSDVTHEATTPAETTKEVQTTEIVETTKPEETTKVNVDFETEPPQYGEVIDKEELRFDIIGIGKLYLDNELHDKYDKTKEPRYTKAIKRIIVNDVVFEISDFSEDYNFFTISSISAYGYTQVFDRPISTEGQHPFCVYQTEEFIAVTCSDVFTSRESTYIFTKNGIIELPEPDVSKVFDEHHLYYNESFHYYDVDEAGRFMYSRSPLKYEGFGGCMDYYLPYCCGLDELAREDGYITLENGEVVYHPEKTYKVEELLGIDYMINGFENERKYFFEKNGATTLEELIEYNKAHYEVYS